MVFKIEFLQKLCRICCTECSKKNYAFKDKLHSKESITIGEVFVVITSLNMAQYPAMPRRICHSCCNQLLKAHKLQQKAQWAHSFFVDQLKRLDYDIKNIDNHTVMTKWIATGKANGSLDTNDRNINKNDKSTHSDPYFDELEFIEISENLTSDPLVDEEALTCSKKPEVLHAEYDSLIKTNYDDSVVPDDIGILTFKEPNKSLLTEAGTMPHQTTMDINTIAYNDSIEPEKKVNGTPTTDTKETDEQLNQHIIRQSKVKSYVCEICQKSFAKSASYQRHSITHSEEHPFKCEKCSKCLNNAFSLRRHLKYHSKTEMNKVRSTGFPAALLLKTQLKRNALTYECAKCGKSFNSATILRSHRLNHRKRNLLFKCSNCPKSFNKSLELQVHAFSHYENDKRVTSMIEEASTNIFANKLTTNNTEESNDDNSNLESKRKVLCTHCGKYYANNRNLSIHLKSVDNLRQHKCTICKKGFNASRSLGIHLLTHQSVGQFKCDKCDKSFKRQDSLIQHLRRHYNVKPYKCKNCAKCFAAVPNLIDHKKTHHKQLYPYECTKCDNRFANTANLEKHLKRHTSTTTYDCTRCEKSFATAVKLRFHLSSKLHNDDNSVKQHFRCRICGRCLTSATFLQSHLSRHAKVDGLHQCVTCAMVFQTSNELQQHLCSSDSCKEKDMHIGTMYKCSTCNKNFANAIILKSHLNRHQNIKPYKCEPCSKSFCSTSDLRVHRYGKSCKARVSSGRTFNCEKCGKCFDKSNSLKDHLNRHNNIRPYKCDPCNKSFHTFAGLGQHKRTKSCGGILHYACNLCDKRYAQRRDLRMHCQNHHATQL